MTDKKSFMIYLDWKEQFNLLSNEQAGILIKSLLHYAETGEKLQTNDGMLVMAFSFIVAQMDRDAEKYNEKCEKNRLIALEREIKKRERTYTNVHEREPTCTNSTDTDTDTDKDKDTDKDTDTDTSGDKSPEPPESVGDSGKAEKKAKKSESAILTEIIQAYTSNPELQNALQEFIKVRNKIKKPITERGLKSALKKLDRLATTDEWKIATVDNSIEHCWQSFYETTAPMNGGNANGENGYCYGTTL